MGPRVMSTWMRPNFFRWTEIARLMGLDRQKRTARHLCRFLALGFIVWMVNRSHQDFLKRLHERGQPIELADAREALPSTHSLESDTNDPSVLLAFDGEGNELGRLTQTSPLGDSAIGFSGSTNLLVAWDGDERVTSVSIRSSGDTIDHVDAIREYPAFFHQFTGKSTEDLAQGNNVEAVSGATLTSLAITDALALRFGGAGRASRFPQPIQVGEVMPYFPESVQLSPSNTHPSLLEVLDADGQLLGQVGRTSPHADQVIGYQGPVDTLLAIDLNGRLVGMKVRSSYENKPYSEYLNDDAYFTSIFQGRSIPQLAEMDLVEEEVEGVSGATMTSMAMADGIVKTAGAWEQEHLRAGQTKPLVNWSVRDTGSLVVMVFAGFVAFTRPGRQKGFRLFHQALLIGYLGLVNGHVLSQALFFGWAQSGVPWERAPILALLTLAALLVPMATGKPFYCHQLCPHGAAQQWMGKMRKQPVHLPAKVNQILEWIPFLLLALIVLLVFKTSAHTVAILEPFDAYVWQVAGGVTITIAILGLVASAFVPMAYCRYGCPTGAMLKLFEFRTNDNGWGRRDYLSFALLAFALVLHFST
jgi:NosR/NirI family nitrous oxide reductase transcriptional regulator